MDTVSVFSEGHSWRWVRYSDQHEELFYSADRFSTQTEARADAVTENVQAEAPYRLIILPARRDEETW